VLLTYTTVGPVLTASSVTHDSKICASTMFYLEFIEQEIWGLGYFQWKCPSFKTKDKYRQTHKHSMVIL